MQSSYVRQEHSRKSRHNDLDPSLCGTFTERFPLCKSRYHAHNLGLRKSYLSVLVQGLSLLAAHILFKWSSIKIRNVLLVSGFIMGFVYEPSQSIDVLLLAWSILLNYQGWLSRYQLLHLSSCHGKDVDTLRVTQKLLQRPNYCT